MAHRLLEAALTTSRGGRTVEAKGPMTPARAAAIVDRPPGVMTLDVVKKLNRLLARTVKKEITLEESDKLFWLADRIPKNFPVVAIQETVSRPPSAGLEEWGVRVVFGVSRRAVRSGALAPALEDFDVPDDLVWYS